jgi:hypothetical protein
MRAGSLNEDEAPRAVAGAAARLDLKNAFEHVKLNEPPAGGRLPVRPVTFTAEQAPALHRRQA